MAKPLVPLTAIWERESKSDYPETIRVPMDDGHVVTYKLDIEQPHPCFTEAMNILDRWDSWPKGSYRFRHRAEKSRGL